MSFYQRGGDPFANRPPNTPSEPEGVNPPPSGVPPANRPGGPIQGDWLSNALQYVKASVGPPATQWAERAQAAISPNQAQSPRAAISLGASLGGRSVPDDGDLSDVEKLHRWTAENPTQTPFAFTITGSVVTAGAAPTYQVIPLIGAATQTGVPAGYRWMVGRVSIMGTDAFTAIGAGQAALFKGGFTPSSGLIAPSIGLVWISGAAGSIPATALFGDRIVMVKPSEQLYIVTKGHGNNQLLTAEVELIIYNERQQIKL